MDRETLKTFRLPEIARISRTLILGALVTGAALTTTPANAAGNNFLDDLALGIAKGRAVQNGLQNGGNLTIKCREPGDPLVEANSNNYGYSLGNYGGGSNTIYRDPKSPECQNNQTKR